MEVPFFVFGVSKAICTLQLVHILMAVVSSESPEHIYNMYGSDPIPTTRPIGVKFLAPVFTNDEGAVVRKAMGSDELGSLDPFVNLFHFSVSLPAGFPDHPHRGFESVTYMLQGGLTVKDFTGNECTIRAGEAQWMTAGRGIIHSEMPAREGSNEALQLWINLSSRYKMTEPKCQIMSRKDIGRAEKDGVEVKVIAGEALGVSSPVYTQTPIMFLDFTLRPGAHIHQTIPESWNSFVYVIHGEGIFGIQNSSPVTDHCVLVLGAGEGVSVWNKSTNSLRFVLIGGQPLNEPIVNYGPFVMNTQDEIENAIQDHHYFRNGFEKGKLN